MCDCRLRADAERRVDGVAAAQERLRQRDEEALQLVKRVMDRYRQGLYVSEAEVGTEETFSCISLGKPE